MEFLQSMNPHLCWRESMHPRDDADTFVVVFSSFESCRNFSRRIDCSFVNNFYRQIPGIVQSFDNLIRMSVHLNNCITAVQKLSSCDEPYFIITKCHNCNVLMFYIVIILFLFVRNKRWDHAYDQNVS